MSPEAVTSPLDAMPPDPAPLAPLPGAGAAARQRLANIIGAGQHFLLGTHRFPDGDGIGAAFGLYLALENLGKTPVFVSPDPIPYNLRFLEPAAAARDTVPARAFDAVIICDTADPTRAGVLPLPPGASGPVFFIDHHKETRPAPDIYLDPGAGAVGELVYYLLRAAKAPITPAVARCLYTSIISDTGSFRYEKTTPRVMGVAGQLLACGVNPWDVASELYESQPRERLELLAKALATLQVSPCGRFAFITVSQGMLADAGGDAAMLDGFVNYPRSIKGIEVACVLHETGDGATRASLRSAGRYDLAPLGSCFGIKPQRNSADIALAEDVPRARARLLDVLTTGMAQPDGAR